jgi:NADPH2:quinone reductase
VKYAFDAVSEHNSYQKLSQVLSKGDSKTTLVRPGEYPKEILNCIEKSTTIVSIVHMDVYPDSDKGKSRIKTGGKYFGFAHFRLFPKACKKVDSQLIHSRLSLAGSMVSTRVLANVKGGVDQRYQVCFQH